MFTNFNLTSKMEFCRCHGVLTEKLNGCSSPRKRSRCDASLRSCASGLETCEGAEPRDGAGGQRARWRAALGTHTSGEVQSLHATRGAHPALTGFFSDGDRLQSLLRLQDSDCTRSEPFIFTVNGPDLSLQ